MPKLLQEDGSGVLLEDASGYLLTEAPADPPPAYTFYVTLAGTDGKAAPLAGAELKTVPLAGSAGG